MEYDSTVRGTNKRLGDKPQTSTSGPHSQLTQQSTRLIWETLVELSLAIPHVIQGVSAVSPRASIALLFDDLIDITNPATSLSPRSPLEPAHIHGPHDTSTHLCLPPERALEVCELGWGEPHQFADFGTEIMVYGPRDESEIEVVMGFIGESISYARENGLKA